MKEMSLGEHLGELRTRVIRVVVILIVAFFMSFSVSDIVTEYLLSPLRLVLGNIQGKVVYLGILDKVLTQFQLAFWIALPLSSPFWFREIWNFIRPALYDNEVKVVRPFIILGFMLFWAGVAFGYFLVFPLTFEIIMSLGVSNVEAMISLRDYIVLAMKVLVMLGFLFQLPNVLIVLNLMGLVNVTQLSNARRYVITAFAVIAAILTPPDVITMLSMWIPMVLLYELGILIIRFFVNPFFKK